MGKFLLNPLPAPAEMAKLGNLIDLEIERLVQMFPPENRPSNPRPIRLCAACYGEASCH
ncbi:MAG: hypothetical protein LH702_06620 [Phormidesmis sp. CAN_BIN44]|nr:hypothetical protein [Phormidesmis sp. CAN_BIN44]